MISYLELIMLVTFLKSSSSSNVILSLKKLKKYNSTVKIIKVKITS